MKRYALYLLVVAIWAAAVGTFYVAREMRDRSYPRRIYFVQGHGLWYILAREYRSHWIVGDRLILDTVKGPITLDRRQASTIATLEKIAELKQQGVIPETPQ